MNPDNWIMRVERYFSLNRPTNSEMNEVAVISFEADALQWFQWENKRRPIKRWDELKEHLLCHFRSKAGGILCEQF